MAQFSKWIEPNGQGESPHAITVLALKNRLAAVEHFLPLAAQRADEDIEFVHQLRVTSRRAAAALQVFQDFLPRRRSKRMMKRLRTIRRAANDARDLDVLGGRIGKIASETSDDGLDQVLHDIRTRREMAQQPLIAVYKDMRKSFSKKSAKLIDRVKWRGDGEQPTFSEMATQSLHTVVNRFFAAAEGDLHNPTALHEMRIQGKRLRYAMELLASAFDRSFREDLYPAFEDVQDRLGIINDHVTAGAMFQRWSQNTNCGCAQRHLSDLAATEAQRADETATGFRRWWTPERDWQLREKFEEHLSPTARVHEVAAESIADSTDSAESVPA